MTARSPFHHPMLALCTPETRQWEFELFDQAGNVLISTTRSDGQHQAETFLANEPYPGGVGGFTMICRNDHGQLMHVLEYGAQRSATLDGSVTHFNTWLATYGSGVNIILYARQRKADKENDVLFIGGLMSFRHTTRIHASAAPRFESIRGMVDPGESLMHAATRELQEEAGLRLPIYRLPGQPVHLEPGMMAHAPEADGSVGGAHFFAAELAFDDLCESTSVPGAYQLSPTLIEKTAADRAHEEYEEGTLGALCFLPYERVLLEADSQAIIGAARLQAYLRHL